MKIYVDIDNTILLTNGSDYKKSKPILENIEKINQLYDKGNEIIYWSARGSVSGVDWTSLTERQLKRFGCKYHELKLGKPSYDLFICDKAINIDLL